MEVLKLEETLHPPLTEYKLFEFSNGKKSVEVNVPMLTVDNAEGTLEILRKNRDAYLAKKHTKEILEVLGQVNERWLDRSYDLRKEALEMLPIITGFSTQMVEHTLDGMMRSFSYENLYRMFQVELGHPFIFDEFIQLPGLNGSIKGYLINGGPKVYTVSNAGNVHVLSMLGVNRCTPLKASTLNKVASEEPSFLTHYKMSIKEVDENIAKCIGIVCWEGINKEVRKKAFNTDGLEAYGGPMAIRDCQEMVKEIEEETGRKIPANYYGHKIALGFVGREFLRSEEMARDVARTVGRSASLYQQQGCLSLQELETEEGGVISPLEFARILNEEMETVNKELPWGEYPRKTKEEISVLRGEVEFDSVMEGNVKIFYPNKPDWTIVYDERVNEFNPCENVLIRVRPVKNMEEFIARASSIKEYLQTIGLKVNDERKLVLADRLGEIGAARICEIEKMGYPEVGPHDRYFRIRRLINPYVNGYAVIEK